MKECTDKTKIGNVLSRANYVNTYVGRCTYEVPTVNKCYGQYLNCLKSAQLVLP